MSWPFAIVAALTVASAAAAMSLRNLVHCALAVTVTLAGLAMLYLQLDAQFVGFAQVLVYIGAVAILIVFAILLTRGSEPSNQRIFSPGAVVGLGIAAVVFAILCWVFLSSDAVKNADVMPPAPEATVRQIGAQLMDKYVLPLEVAGLLLTAALIGAAIIAMREKEAE
jgi:NADH-quinone oxidoreductase subunit J